MGLVSGWHDENRSRPWLREREGPTVWWEGLSFPVSSRQICFYQIKKESDSNALWLLGHPLNCIVHDMGAEIVLSECLWHCFMLSDIEQEVHDVTVLYDVVLAFDAQLSGGTAGSL